MHGPPVVFYERTGNWAAVWRRLEARLAPTAGRALPPRLVETRSAAECREALTKHRGSFLIAELATPSVEPTLELLFDALLNARDVATAVVAPRQLLPYQGLSRELGAQAFVVSPLEFEALRALALRHLAKSPAIYADPRERIWKNLPWS